MEAAYTASNRARAHRRGPATWIFAERTRPAGAAAADERGLNRLGMEGKHVCPPNTHVMRPLDMTGGEALAASAPTP